MASTSQPKKGRKVVLQALDATVQALEIAVAACPVANAKAIIGPICIIVTMIRVRPPYPPAKANCWLVSIKTKMANSDDCIQLEQKCLDVKKILDKVSGSIKDDLSKEVVDAIEGLNKWARPAMRTMSR
jgi:hypothetical protein